MLFNMPLGCWTINAILMSGSDTLLVSNDQLRDHLHHITASRFHYDKVTEAMAAEQ